MEKIVYINITEPNKVIFIFDDGKNQKKVVKNGARLNLLLLLDLFLKKCKLDFKDIRAFVLLEGGGSFSGVRQAAAILNTIHLIKKIKVIGLDIRLYQDMEEIKQAANEQLIFDKEEFIKPIYSGEPNITKPKNKV